MDTHPGLEWQSRAVGADDVVAHLRSGMRVIHGAALSPGGKPVIAMPATAAGGKVSRIVPALHPGAGVVTTRGHVHWVATEYGCVNLHGMTLRERGEALVGLAHPDFRAELRRELAQVRHFVL